MTQSRLGKHEPWLGLLTFSSFEQGDIAWFLNGKLNVCFNCVDRHVLNGKGSQVALICEGDEPNDVRKVTYDELLQEV